MKRHWNPRTRWMVLVGIAVLLSVGFVQVWRFQVRRQIAKAHAYEAEIKSLIGGDPRFEDVAIVASGDYDGSIKIDGVLPTSQALEDLRRIVKPSPVIVIWRVRVGESSSTMLNTLPEGR